MKLHGTLLATVLPVVFFAHSSFGVIKNNTDDSLKRLKRCYSNSWNYGGYNDNCCYTQNNCCYTQNDCCYTQNNWCQPSPCYPTADPCSTYPPATYPPATYPPATYPPVTYPPVTYPPVTYPPVTYPPVTYPPVTYPPPYTSLWPTVSPIPTRPPYTPIWPTVTPYPTRPTYIPIWQTVSPYPTPIWQTRTPIPTTRPAYTPIWQTRTPNPTYHPIWQTRTPNPTYIPIWQTRTPNPTYIPTWQTQPTVTTTRPAYTPIGPTRPVIRPTYIPIGQTVDPIIPIGQTRPVIRPTYIPIGQTVDPIIPIGQTRPVIRPTYIPIGQTVDPITPRRTLIPIWQTKPPKAERQQISDQEDDYEDETEDKATNKVFRTPVTYHGCKKACLDEQQRVYCCENDNSVCPVIDKALCEEEYEGLSFRKYLGDNCTIDSQCQANNKCCYNFCDDEYYCTNVQKWNISSRYDMQNYPPEYDRLQRHTGDHHGNMKLTIVFPAESSDSMALLVNLAYLVDEFKNYVTFNLLPVETQVGATEISENLGMGEIILCAANQNPDQRALLYLTICLMSSDLLHPTTKVKDAHSAARKCGRDAGYRWRHVSTCIKEKKGRHLLMAVRWDYRFLLDSLQQRHLSSIFYGSPIMALNGMVLNTPPQVSVDWLREEICKHLVHIHDIPSICETFLQPLTDVESR